MMRCLITGGAGFIGSHLAEELLEKGDDVIVIDDLSTGSIENLKHLIKNKKLKLVVDTIFNEPLLAELIDKSDVIFHLAASVGVMLIVNDPVKTIETNISGTEIVLKYASKKGKVVVISSTSEVYGKSSKVPFKEGDDIVLGPTTKGRWSYACSKAIDEFLALAYWRQKNLPVIIVRLFNTVGPRQRGRYGMVIPRFIKQALNNEPITIFGTGEQSRCFGYVKDVVGALIKLSQDEKFYGQVFNIGSDEEIKIKKLAEVVKRKTKSKSEIIFIPYDRAYEKGFEDIQRRVPDLTKIRSSIGYKPTRNINEILDEMIKYQKLMAYSCPRVE